MVGMLPDGRYEAFVVWAEEAADDPAGAAGAPEAPTPAPREPPRRGPALTVELTITTGSHKGEVVSVSAVGLDADPLSLTGMPCTLVVEGGEPRLEP